MNYINQELDFMATSTQEMFNEFEASMGKVMDNVQTGCGI